MKLSVITIVASDALTATCSHTWSGWTTKTNATQATTGLKERTCTNCGKPDQATIPALGGGSSGGGSSGSSGGGTYRAFNWSIPVKDQYCNEITAGYHDPTYKLSTPHWGMDLAHGSYPGYSTNQACPGCGNKPGSLRNNQVAVATVDGIVRLVAETVGQISGAGWCVSIETDSIDPTTNKKISITYMHFAEKSTLKVGDKVKKGQTVIGKIGTTPNVDWHLHVQMTNSQTYNKDMKDTNGYWFGFPTKSKSTYINPILFYDTSLFQGRTGIYS